MLSLISSVCQGKTQDQGIWSSLGYFSDGKSLKGGLCSFFENLLTFHRVVFCCCDKQVEFNVTTKVLAHNTRLSST